MSYKVIEAEAREHVGGLDWMDFVSNIHEYDLGVVSVTPDFVLAP